MMAAERTRLELLRGVMAAEETPRTRLQDWLVELVFKILRRLPRRKT